MIVQGSNTPITVTFDVQPADVEITLHNEIEILKQWDYEELVFDETGLVCKATYTQDESLQWEEGPCEIEVRWIDATGDFAGEVQTQRRRELIEWSKDQTILEA